MQAEGIGLRVDVGADDVQRVAGQRPLDLLAGVILRAVHVQVDGPVIDRVLDHAAIALANASTGDFRGGALASPELAGVTTKLEVFLQEDFAGGSEVGGVAEQVSLVVHLAVLGPTLHLLEDVEAERIDALWRNVPPQPGAS